MPFISGKLQTLNEPFSLLGELDMILNNHCIVVEGTRQVQEQKCPEKAKRLGELGTFLFVCFFFLFFFVWLPVLF